MTEVHPVITAENNRHNLINLWKVFDNLKLYNNKNIITNKK